MKKSTKKKPTGRTGRELRGTATLVRKSDMITGTEAESITFFHDERGRESGPYKIKITGLEGIPCAETLSDEETLRNYMIQQLESAYQNRPCIAGDFIDYSPSRIEIKVQFDIQQRLQK